jgi:hypothetical protein
MSTTEPTSLREHIQAEEAESQGGTGAPADAVTPGAPPVEEPVPQLSADHAAEQEADSVKPDAELSEAARTLRKGRAEARKAKIQGEIDELVATRNRLRDDIASHRAAEPRPAASSAPRPATAHVADPDDPKPKEDDYQDYGQFLIDNARWAARDEFRQQQAAAHARSRRTEAEQRLDAHAKKLDGQHAALREEYADADAVIETFTGALRDAHPQQTRDIASYLASSDVGGQIAYRLGKDAEALKDVLKAPNQMALARALARVESAITSPKPAAPVTRAPAPPKHTVGGGASSTSAPDTTKPGTLLKDHIRAEEAEIAERRRAGYRY